MKFAEMFKFDRGPREADAELESTLDSTPRNLWELARALEEPLPAQLLSRENFERFFDKLTATMDLLAVAISSGLATTMFIDTNRSFLHYPVASVETMQPQLLASIAALGFAMIEKRKRDQRTVRPYQDPILEAYFTEHLGRPALDGTEAQP